MYYGDEFGVEGGFGEVGGSEGADEVDEAEDGEGNGAMARQYRAA